MPRRHQPGGESGAAPRRRRATKPPTGRRRAAMMTSWTRWVEDPSPAAIRPRRGLVQTAAEVERAKLLPRIGARTRHDPRQEPGLLRAVDLRSPRPPR